jgi:L-threonylcarbamoyladenylate synthase
MAGANAFDRDAIDRIFAAKERPFSDPDHTYRICRNSFLKVAYIIPDFRHGRLSSGFGGPFDHHSEKEPASAGQCRTGLDTAAVRMPAHAILLRLIEEAQVPVAAPSANLLCIQARRQLSMSWMT